MGTEDKLGDVNDDEAIFFRFYDDAGCCTAFSASVEIFIMLLVEQKKVVLF